VIEERFWSGMVSFSRGVFVKYRKRNPEGVAAIVVNVVLIRDFNPEWVAVFWGEVVGLGASDG
jgi:hypothetical protein